jgi:hypothetical protein
VEAASLHAHNYQLLLHGQLADVMMYGLMGTTYQMGNTVTHESPVNRKTGSRNIAASTASIYKQWKRLAPPDTRSVLSRIRRSHMLQYFRCQCGLF